MPTGTETFTQAQAGYYAGDLRRAEGLCREFLAADRGHCPAWLLLGDALLGQGRHTEAPDDFRQGGRLRPDSADAAFGLG